MSLLVSPALRYAKSLQSYNPIPRGLVFSTLLWSPSLRGSVFESVEGLRHTCTVTGAVKVEDGRDLDGSDDFIDLGSNAAFDIVSSFTVEAWVKLDVPNGDEEVVFIKLSGTKHAIVLYARNNPYIKIEDDVGQNSAVWTKNLTAGTFYHLVGVLDDAANTLKFYGDGTLQATTSSVTRTPRAGITAINIGRQTSGVRQLDGTIGEVRVYNRALTPLEIQHNYLATKWRYV